MFDQLKLDNQLCFRLYTAARMVTSAYTPLFKDLGITYPQYLVLMVLWEKDHCLIGDITERLKLETNTVTPLLQRMERQGLIERKRGDIDTRVPIYDGSEMGVLQAGFNEMMRGLQERQRVFHGDHADIFVVRRGPFGRKTVARGIDAGDDPVPQLRVDFQI